MQTSKMRFLKVLKEPRKIDLKFATEQKEAIKELGLKYDLSLFYIFGSLAEDNMKRLSDVDLAIQSASRKSINLDIFLKLIREIQDIFKREDIDLVDLREAPPLLRMRILKVGKPFYIKSKQDLIDFRFRTISDYLKTSFLRKSFSRYLEYAILGVKT